MCFNTNYLSHYFVFQIEQMVRHGTDPTAVDTDGRDVRAIVKAKYGEDIASILDAASRGLRVKRHSSKENSA